MRLAEYTFSCKAASSLRRLYELVFPAEANKAAAIRLCYGRVGEYRSNVNGHHLKD